ncbi:zinc ribbon domain-containing protein [candidate division KSB1 bacterium]|nr:zinc ribbon domain-containing protein [candidate division KSB1 bacterium]
MAQTKKTPGLIIFIVIASLFLLILLPFLRFGLGYILGMPLGESAVMLPGFFHGRFLPLFPILLILLITLFWLLITIWVYNDAERNKMSGALWALLVFFGNIIALIIYLIVRSSMATSSAMSSVDAEVCPRCKGAVQADYIVCPHCGASLKITCPHCGKSVQSGWKHCAYCGKAL